MLQAPFSGPHVKENTSILHIHITVPIRLGIRNLLCHQSESHPSSLLGIQKHFNSLGRP
jgi:hypothetical protein